MFCSQFKVGLSAFLWYFTEKKKKTRTKQETQKNLCVFSLTQMPGLAFWAAREGQRVDRN